MNTFIHGSEVQDETGEVSRKGGLVDFDKEAQKLIRMQGKLKAGLQKQETGSADCSGAQQ